MYTLIPVDSSSPYIGLFTVVSSKLSFPRTPLDIMVEIGE